MQNEISNHEWITIPEAIGSWRAAPGYDRLYSMIKRSSIEARRRGRYLTFRLADLQEKCAQQQFFTELTKGMTDAIGTPDRSPMTNRNTFRCWKAPLY